MVSLNVAYEQWRRKIFLPESDRQLKVLETYQAFLSETPLGNFGAEMISALTILWDSTFE